MMGEGVWGGGVIVALVSERKAQPEPQNHGGEKKDGSEAAVEMLRMSSHGFRVCGPGVGTATRVWSGRRVDRGIVQLGPGAGKGSNEGQTQPGQDQLLVRMGGTVLAVPPETFWGARGRFSKLWAARGFLQKKPPSPTRPLRRHHMRLKPQTRPSHPRRPGSTDRDHGEVKNEALQGSALVGGEDGMEPKPSKEA
jgi:hypothetical protein